MPSDPLREFLMSRRASIEPVTVGLPESTTRRRGRGLRREEVAALAGVSVDYYARLEQGRAGHVSDQVLTAIENALQLDNLEREHLRALLAPSHKPATGSGGRTRVRVTVRNLIQSMDPIPVMLLGPRFDVLDQTPAARVLLADFATMPLAGRNIARWLFLDPETRVRYPDWEEIAAQIAAALRASLNPRTPDEALNRLVDELTASSPDFVRLWSEYRLDRYSHGKTRFVHAEVGTFTLNWETLHIPGPEGMQARMYTADPGSRSDEQLRTLLRVHGIGPRR